MAMAREARLLVGATVTGATGVITSQRGTGLTSVVRTGAGVYDVTLAEEADALECNMQATIRAAVSGMIATEHVSDVLKRVRTFSGANVAADLDFDFVILRV